MKHREIAGKDISVLRFVKKTCNIALNLRFEFHHGEEPSLMMSNGISTRTKEERVLCGDATKRIVAAGRETKRIIGRVILSPSRDSRILKRRVSEQAASIA